MYDRRMFFRFVIPSVLAFALSGVYTIVDGFFVGNSLGDMGLAAINVGYPITALIQAAGTGIGLSGAIRFTIQKGQKKTEDAMESFSAAMGLLAVLSVCLTAGIYFLRMPLIGGLGAEGELGAMTEEYVRVIAFGVIFQVFATGLVPFIRNLDGAAFAMFSMIGGFLTNIALDYLFVWVYGFGMAGAAWATVIGQTVTAGAGVLFLAKKKMKFVLPPRGRLFHLFRIILKAAAAPFGLTFSPQITTILMNRFLMIHGGDQAVAVYGCIAYITAIIYLLLQGVGDGSQPLISGCFSEGKRQEMRKMLRLSYWSGWAVALASMAGFFLARNQVGVLFGASDAASEAVARYLPLYLVPLLFLAYVRITTAYLYATEKNASSYLLVYGEPAFILVFLLILPQIPALGNGGVWLAVPMAQLSVWWVSVFIGRREKADYSKERTSRSKRTA